jgi:hypothetical protein
MPISTITSNSLTQTADLTVNGVTVGKGGGSDSTTLGYQAGNAGTSNYYTMLGYQAGFSNTDSAAGGVFVGWKAGYANTSGQSNTAIGVNALVANTTASNNVAVGAGSLAANTTGSPNVAVGNLALRFTTTGGSNVGMGYQALYSNTTASENVAVGFQAGYTNTVGTQNTFIGVNAGRTSAVSGEARNVAVGYGAGYGLTTGTYNTFVGPTSGQEVTTGSRNTIIGNYSGNTGGLDIRTANNYIVLSDGSGNPRAWSDNNGQFNVINATTNTVKMYVSSSTASYTSDHYQSLSFTTAGTGWNHFVGYSSIGSTTNIKIQGNGNLQNANNSYGAISDIKLKENIVDASPKLDKLMQVKIRNYNLKGDYEQHKQLGVVAQELETVFPSLVEETADKDIEGNDLGTTTKSVKYSVFVPMLIKAIQELKAEFDAYKASHP